MRTRRSLHTIIIALLVLVVGQTWGSEKEWVTLTDCQYVDSKTMMATAFACAAATRNSERGYFVDAPETTLTYAERTREQSLHFGITLDETMKAGVKAKECVQALLQKPFVLRTLWASAAGRARETRYYVLIEVNGKSLAEILVSRGLARVKGVGHVLPSGEKSNSYMDRLTALEQEARAKRVGAWSRAAEDKKSTR